AAGPCGVGLRHRRSVHRGGPRDPPRSACAVGRRALDVADGLVHAARLGAGRHGGARPVPVERIRDLVDAHRGRVGGGGFLPRVPAADVSLTDPDRRRARMSPHPAYKVALMHASCVFLDTPATIDKACALIREAARNGARLVAFAETYVSFFPVWCALRAPIYNHDFFKAAAASAIRIDGAEIAAVRAAAREAGVAVSLGFNEGTEASVGCIWNANVFIGPVVACFSDHRKMVPTFWEKLVWANGDGAGLRVCGTDLGRIGMLVCGENTNPLARFTMIAQGQQVHVASFPPVWPTRDPREAGRYDLASATRIRCGAHAFEGKLFNLVVSSWMDRRMRDALVKGDAEIGRILD